MEQKEDHHQPIQAFGSLSRFRAQRIQQSVAQDSGSERSSMWNEGMCNRVTETDDENMNLKENCSSVKKQRWIRRRAPLIQIRDENNAVIESLEVVGVLGTQSAKKQHVSKSNTNYKKTHLRRSCAPRFMNIESVSPKATSTTGYGGYKSEKTSTLFSSGNQGGDGENVVPNFNQRFLSYFERRRRSRLLKQEVDLETKAKNNTSEDYSERIDRNEDELERIPEDEEKRADIFPSRLTRSRIKMDYQQEAACENKSESKSCFLAAEGRIRLNGTRRRSMVEHVRQRALSSQLSVEEPAISEQRHIVPLEQRPGNSLHRSRLNRWTPHSSLRRIAQQSDPLVTDKTVGEKLQECRRVLEFESGDEGEDTEDHTAPLTMMVQTPVIMRASVLQNPVDQKQQQKVCEPIIKKSLFGGHVKTSRFRRRWSTQISQQPEDDSGQSHVNKELKVSTFSTGISNKIDNSSSEPKNIDLPIHTMGNITVKECHTLQQASTTSCTNISSERKGNFPAHPGSTKRIQRRRSAAVLCVRTPMRRKTINTDGRSMSKLIGSSVSSKIPAPKGSQKHIRLRSSLAGSRPFSLQPQTTDIVAASDNKGLNENKIQNDVTNYKPHKVDASTNTTINLAKIKHVDLKVLEDIENLLKEQEELNIKAVLLQEKTTARRLEMKDKRLMESFITSISPLRRLKTMFTENHVDESEVQESPQHCKAEGEGGVCDGAVATQGPHVSSDQSGMEWESPKAPLNIRDHQIQWRRQNNRLTRTYQEPSIKEEEFSDVYQENTSPFTTLVGDCERPSLAPMTPHSRHHVSLLKLSLKQQLEELYD